MFIVEVPDLFQLRRISDEGISHLADNVILLQYVQEGPELGYFPLVLGLGRQYTPEDMYRGVRLGVAELLYGGVTTVHDWAHNIRGPAYADDGSGDRMTTEPSGKGAKRPLRLGRYEILRQFGE